jgi:hypothetical protein
MARKCFIQGSICIKIPSKNCFLKGQCRAPRPNSKSLAFAGISSAVLIISFMFGNQLLRPLFEHSIEA